MKKIEEIEVGDIVWSHNSENGEKELKEVTELFRFNKNSTITLKINGEEIVTTDLHLFYTLEKSWTSAKDLELGDTVVTLSGEKYKIEAIDKDYYDGIIVVYNFEVEDNHNYYVGDNQVLVHNDGCTVSDKGSSGDGDDKVAEDSNWSSEKGIYSVAFEANLPKDMYPNVSSARHFQESNRQLHEAFQNNAKFSEEMEKLYPGITKGVQPGKRGAFSRNAPTKDVTWHHNPYKEGLLQLVPRNQHKAAGLIQSIFHPEGKGGMEIWGGGR